MPQAADNRGCVPWRDRRCLLRTDEPYSAWNVGAWRILGVWTDCRILGKPSVPILRGLVCRFKMGSSLGPSGGIQHFSLSDCAWPSLRARARSVENARKPFAAASPRDSRGLTDPPDAYFFLEAWRLSGGFLVSPSARFSIPDSSCESVIPSAFATFTRFWKLKLDSPLSMVPMNVR
jgi:hypothetical protein